MHVEVVTIYQNKLLHSACDHVLKIIMWSKIRAGAVGSAILPYNVYQTSIWKNVSSLVNSNISECCQPSLCGWFTNSL